MSTIINKSPRVYTIYKILSFGLIDEEMKYLSTIDLSAGVDTDVTTILTTEPYNIFLLDSSGNDITATVTIQLTLTGGVYHVHIYTVNALTGVKLKILY